MSNTARYVILWPAVVLAIFAVMLVAAPSVMAPLFDRSVSIGGFPAGFLVRVGFWLVLSAVGLVAILLTHRVNARLGVLVAMVVVAAIAFLLAPAVIVAIKDMRVESLGMLARLLEERVSSV